MKKRSYSEDDAGLNHKGEKRDPMKDFVEKTHFFLAIERGMDVDLEFIKNMIENDPKKYLYDNLDPERLCNKQSIDGQTPLYIACKNGHLEIVKMLLSYNANYEQMSQVDRSTEESSLDVAVRWNHRKIVEYLLEHYEWSNKYLKNAIEYSSNKTITELLKSKVKGGRKTICFGLITCGGGKKSYVKDGKLEKSNKS